MAIQNPAEFQQFLENEAPRYRKSPVAWLESKYIELMNSKEPIIDEVRKRYAELFRQNGKEEFANKIETAEFDFWKPSPDNLIPLNELTEDNKLEVGDVIMNVSTNPEDIKSGKKPTPYFRRDMKEYVSFSIIDEEVKRNSALWGQVTGPDADSFLTGFWFDELGGNGGGIGLLDKTGKLAPAYSYGYKLTLDGKREVMDKFPNQF